MGCHSSIPTIPVLPSNSHYGSGQPCPSASTWWIHIPHQYWHYVDHDTINLPHWRTFKFSALLIKGWGRERGTQKWAQMKVKRELVNQVSYKKKNASKPSINKETWTCNYSLYERRVCAGENAHCNSKLIVISLLPTTDQFQIIIF